MTVQATAARSRARARSAMPRPQRARTTPSEPGSAADPGVEPDDAEHGGERHQGLLAALLDQQQPIGPAVRPASRGALTRRAR